MIFLIWDGMYNNGIYLDHTVRALRNFSDHGRPLNTSIRQS
jgi:hypothetical protein